LTSTDRDYRTAKGFNVPNRQDDRDKQELLDDYRRRRVPVKPAKPVADVLSQLLVKKGYAQVQAGRARGDGEELGRAAGTAVRESAIDQVARAACSGEQDQGREVPRGNVLRETRKVMN
jgi:hypothetical protein